MLWLQKFALKIPNKNITCFPNTAKITIGLWAICPTNWELEIPDEFLTDFLYEEQIFRWNTLFSWEIQQACSKAVVGGVSLQQKYLFWKFHYKDLLGLYCECPTHANFWALSNAAMLLCWTPFLIVYYGQMFSGCTAFSHSNKFFFTKRYF